MRKKWIIFCLSGLMLLVLIVACAQASPTPVEEEMDEIPMEEEVEVEEPEETEEMAEPEEEAVDVEALIIERCSGCHSADRVFQADYDAEGWSDEIDDMIRKGAEVNEEEKQLMIDWLVSR